MAIKLGDAIEHNGETLHVWSEGPEPRTWYLCDGSSYYLMNRGEITPCDSGAEQLRKYSEYLDSYRMVWCEQVPGLSLDSGSRIRYHLRGTCEVFAEAKAETASARFSGRSIQHFRELEMFCNHCS